jgi:hypothetical protein
MTFRKLRIAWSVAWGIVAVLLCVMWARSYWIESFCEWSSKSRNYGVHSHAGVVLPGRAMFFSVPFKFHWGERPARKWSSATSAPRPKIGMSIHVYDRSWLLMVSYGWFVIATVVAAGAPWTSFVPKFSLRALLIATTLVAVVLGLIVWLR